MTPPERLSFDARRTALLARADLPRALPDVLARLGLPAPRPTLVLIGGADGLDPAVAPLLAVLFRHTVAPLCARLGALLIDGGTDAGVMALMGRARAASGAAFPLLGVAAAGTVRLPGAAADAASGRAALEPHHSHFLLVPGTEWGDESPWIDATAQAACGDAGTLALVAGGGRITALDAALGIAAGRPTLALAGSGGTADRLAGEAAGGPASGPLQAVPLVAAAAVLPDLIASLLAGRRAPVPS